MPNLAALASDPPADQPEGFLVPDSVAKAPVDIDGLPVPTLWQNSKRWMQLPLALRKRKSEEFVSEEMAKAARPAPKPRTPATRFTTDAAVRWGRRQGWKLIERERYDYRLKRHHDLELGVDAMFDDGQDGRVGIQGAGRGERAPHYQRFLDRGGPDKARRRAVRILYLEFERGNPEPVKLEWWA